MSGLYDAAATVMSVAQRRVEVVSRNVSNVSTAGYKRRIAYTEQLTRTAAAQGDVATLAAKLQLSQGKMISTGNPLDLAIEGDGLFAVRDGERMLYSRQGQFKRDASGAVVTPQGYILQQAGGGDLILDRADAVIDPDGTVNQDGRPIARVGLFAISDPAKLKSVGDAHFAAPDGLAEESTGATVRSGMIEGSNVDLGDEMVSMMAAVRDAERGAKLIQTYDDLLGRVMSSLGKSR